MGHLNCDNVTNAHPCLQLLCLQICWKHDKHYNDLVDDTSTSCTHMSNKDTVNIHTLALVNKCIEQSGATNHLQWYFFKMYKEAAAWSHWIICPSAVSSCASGVSGKMDIKHQNIDTLLLTSLFTVVEFKCLIEVMQLLQTKAFNHRSTTSQYFLPVPCAMPCEHWSLLVFPQVQNHKYSLVK